jgi:hypothetical protein
MIQQACRRARLLAGLNSAATPSQSSKERAALRLLHTSTPLAPPCPDELTPSKMVMLDDWTYDTIMVQLQAEDPMLVSHKHANDSMLRLNPLNIMPQSAISSRHFKFKNRTYSLFSEHTGSSSIIFTTSMGAQWSGYVTHAWMLDVRGVVRTFLTIIPHEQLNDIDQSHNPWSHHTGFKSQLMYYKSSFSPIIIEDCAIVAHAPCRVRPLGTYPGISRETLVVHHYANLGRR